MIGGQFLLMGVTGRPFFDLLRKIRSWIGGDRSTESLMSGSLCRDCQSSSSEHRCRSCGRWFCWKCMQSTGGRGLEESQQPGFCRFCYRAIVSHVEDFSEESDPSVPTERVPESSLAKFGYGKLESPERPSSRLLQCTTRRNYEEEEAEDGGMHFISPMSEASQDLSDTDSVSVNTWNDLYSLKSSPLDSPSGPGDDNSPVAAKSDDLLENSNDLYGDLAVYRNHESPTAQPPLNFVNNDLLWYPPAPEDEEDDIESGFGFDDEDDDVGDLNRAFSSASFSSDAFAVKEKPNDANKEHLKSTIHQHFRALVSQLLKGEGLHDGSECGGDGWLDIVSSLAWQAATFVKPDTNKGGSMDPVNYVKVKCISSGSPSDSAFIKGVVCTKNVKHKRMVSQHKNAKILLLGGSLEYQKVPNRLASINTVLKQEIDHLKMAVSKIETHRPNLLLVEKSVSSYAQEYLLAKDISLVLNVKRTLLERISQCTGAHIAASIDTLASARLGHCEMFRIEKVSEGWSLGGYPSKKSIKTLMFFEGCPRRLGCTVVLKGSCREELKKVKHVVQYASFAAYHLSLETSFLADEGASLPNFPMKPSIPTPENLTSPNTYVSPLSDDILGITSEREERNSSFEHTGLPPVESQINRDCTVGSIPDLLLCGCESSVSGFQCKEPIDLGQFRTDLKIHEDELLENSFPEEDNIPNNRHSCSAPGHNVVDIDDGDSILSEHFPTSGNHQSILVSLSRTCIVKGTVCERSQLLRIKFYGSFDKPLGRYLRDDLFGQTSSCRSCKEPAEAHVLCYTHQQGNLTISIRRLHSMKLPGEGDGRIWMWHRCLKCEHKDGIPPAVHRVVMSDAAWGLSFGKFLELSFSNHATANRIASCGHSLQKDCLRFYGFGSVVAFFRYSPVDIYSIHLPPLLLNFAYDVQQEWIQREAYAISGQVEFLYKEVINALHNIEQRITAFNYEPLRTSINKHILALKDLLRRERYEYDALLQPASSGNVDILELNRLRHCLLIDSYAWDRRLYLLDSVSTSKSAASKVDLQLSEIITCPKLKEWRDELFSIDGCFDNSLKETTITLSGASTNSLFSKQSEEVGLQVSECKTNNLVEMDLSIESVEGYVGSAGLNLVSGQCYKWDGEQIGAEDCNGGAASLLENEPSPETNLSDKIDLAWTGSGQVPTSFSIGNAETDSVGSFSLMDNPCYRKVTSPIRVHSFDSALRFQNKIHGGLSSSLHFSSVKSFDSRDIVKDPIQKNMRRAYTQRSLQTFRSLSFLPSHTPLFITSASRMMNEGARLLLPQPRVDNVIIAVYENDPTSIISYAISSEEHVYFVASNSDQDERLNENGKIRTCGNQMGQNAGTTSLVAQESISYFKPDDLQSNEPQPSRGSLSLGPKDPHLRISFDDESPFPLDKVKFSVTCYFAKQFDALRKKICPTDVDFIRSLSRCMRWKAQGGKSNVYFAKSLDERFIIKQVTKTELDSFEEFAPEYFKYLMESINSGSPTCLAKVLGIYQVTIKHLKGGREVKMDLMVMENVFYRRSISRVYDLKGSARARYNSDTSGNKVLLDLNLVEALHTSPIFLGNKAKRSLERAVWNDTSFLASIDVMDYSLLVGVDEERKELVMGIIDFMRQYTWDKHLETWVKASGFLGGPRNVSPTVVSPKQYKKRFRKAMSGYFPTVPHQWPS